MLAEIRGEQGCSSLFNDDELFAGNVNVRFDS